MSWPSWLGLVFVGFVVLLLLAARSWRAGVRRDLRAYLSEHAPEFTVVSEMDSELRIRTVAGAEGTLNLTRLFDTLSAEKSWGAERHRAFAEVTKLLHEMESAQTVDPARDLPRLRPRLLLRDVADGFPTEIDALPREPLGDTNLVVVLVLNSETSVSYVSERILTDLGVSFAEARARAIENLAPTLTEAVVRRTVTEGALTVVKSFDTYDAARILLVGRYLAPDEEVVALVSDRDTLALAMPPRDGDWSGLRKLARAAAGDPLCDVPLIVSPTSIRRAP